MSIQNIPESFLNLPHNSVELFIYDYKMTDDVVKSKVNLTMNMFSFLQTGEKQVQLADDSVTVNNKQSLLIKTGNCLMTELIDKDHIYFCKLFFFSNKKVLDFLDKYAYSSNLEKPTHHKETTFFVIENDDYIHTYLSSLSNFLKLKTTASDSFLSIKFEEIMLYLIDKYGDTFVAYLQTLVATETKSSFHKIIEANIYTNLSLSEIAFLTNMSLSTFKRHFNKEYQANPGKWLQQKRLARAKEILDKGEKKPSEIYLEYGYNNLSNFSIAYKNEFGYSPKVKINK
jgi:AraC family transcriptional regulator, exoenzyme S synthesis regulatory protein ExsA